MSARSESKEEFKKIEPRISEFRRFLRVFLSRKLVIFGLIIILILIISAIFAPLIAPYDPYKQDLNQILSQPSHDHPLGTDSLGRDTLSRIIYGSRTSLIIGFVAIGIAASVGIAIGMVAGYFGGVISLIIMRIIDAWMSFPLIVLALLLVVLFGTGLNNVILALGIGLVPGYARMMCGQVLSIKENDYIIASKGMGASNIYIMFVHIFKNSMPPLIVLITMMIGACILAEAGLSFLGLGISPPGAAWGAMVYEGYRYLLSNWMLSFAPGIAIMLVVFAFNMVGDGLRDALDPRLRGTI